MASMAGLRILVVASRPRIDQLYRMVLYEHEIEVAGGIEEVHAARARTERDVILLTEWELVDGTCAELCEALDAAGDRAERILYAPAPPAMLAGADAGQWIHRFIEKPGWQALIAYLGRLAARKHAYTPWPAKRRERRAGSRVPRLLTVCVRCASWRAARRVPVIDMGPGGMALLAPEPLDPDTPIWIAFRLPSGHPIELSGEVASTCPLGEDGSGGGWRVGVRLGPPRVDDGQLLRAFLLEEQPIYS
jgi:hypothetical protein